MRAQQAAIEAALLVLDKLGISPADLTAIPRERPELPSFAAYVPVVSAVVSAPERAVPTAPAGTGWSSSGAADAWTSRRPRRSAS